MVWRIITPSSGTPMDTPLYPLFFRLEGRPVLVVGGGEVAARKVAGLLECGARLKVVAPAACDSLVTLAEEGTLAWHRRPFELSDIEGMALVFAATDDPDVNGAVGLAARRQGIPFHSASHPETGDFFNGAVFRNGAATVAVSTGGTAPGLARILADGLAPAFPAHAGHLIAVVGAWRERILRKFPENSLQRKEALAALLAPDHILQAMQAGETILERLFEEFMRPFFPEGRSE